jgi:hypothetical protein
MFSMVSLVGPPRPPYHMVTSTGPFSAAVSRALSGQSGRSTLPSSPMATVLPPVVGGSLHAATRASAHVSAMPAVKRVVREQRRMPRMRDERRVRDMEPGLLGGKGA